MASTFATIRGFRCALSFSNYAADAIIVSFDGCETEDQAKDVAVAAARHSYPEGTIDVIEIQSGKWCPTGLSANESGSAIWVN